MEVNTLLISLACHFLCAVEISSIFRPDKTLELTRPSSGDLRSADPMPGVETSSIVRLMIVASL